MEIICDRDLSNVVGGTRTCITGVIVGSNIGALVGSAVGFYNGVKRFKKSVVKNGDNTNTFLGVVGIQLENFAGSLIGGIAGAGVGFMAGATIDAVVDTDLTKE